MDDYSIIGRVIDRHHAPVPDLTVEVRRRGELRRSEEVVGTTATGPDGRFELVLDRRGAGGMLARLGEAVPILLVLRDRHGRTLMTTRAVPIDWQLEFRIFLGGGRRVPGAPDVYKSSTRRIISGTRESGMGDRLRKGPGGRGALSGWMKERLFMEPTEDSGGTVNLLFAVSDGAVAGTFETPRLQLVEYDGAQVPRRGWEAPDDQAVIWSRREKFRWA